jgi:SAM-dependent methyltransferase
VFRGLAAGSVAFTYNDGRRLPYADGSFDIVFHNSVIEHVPDAAAFNREVRRVLRPGGVSICITGTPALCRFRLVRDWFLMLPVLAAVALLREAPLLRELAVGLLRFLGASDATRQKVRERLLRVDDRARALAGPAAAGPETPCRLPGLRKLYARLFHVLYFPEYNRPVLEGAAAETGRTPEELLACVADHFGRPFNRLRFAFTPPTHGQHYRSAWHEMEEWRIDRWRQQFDQAGLTVEDVQGYRFHQLLELTPSASWNARIFARAAKWIHRAIGLRMFDPACATEIVIVARRNA